tara:strand:- start:15 stop:377 length:363 start_codon:yes stop_codon:yes gene_type:complete
MKLQKFREYVQKQELGKSVETARVLISQVKQGIIGKDAETGFDNIVKAEQLYKKAIADVKDRLRVMQKLQSRVDKEIQDEGSNRGNFGVAEDLDDAINDLKELERDFNKNLNKIKNISFR